MSLNLKTQQSDTLVRLSQVMTAWPLLLKNRLGRKEDDYEDQGWVTG